MFSFHGYSQNPTSINLSPNGVLDNVFDNYGNRYKLSDIVVNRNNIPLANRSVLLICNSNSIFNLYFEPGCGMDSATDSEQINRRTVLCQVFNDLSDFITNSTSPIIINNNKVNIWVRNINNIPNVPSNALGLATAFYVAPSNATQGGIIDNEIWKTIHTGKDSYINTIAPLIPNAPSINASGSFYHGMVAFNFNVNAGVPIFDWYTTPLNSLASVGKYDLYSVILHEMTHALGFNSLLNQYGASLFGDNFKYYSRYDRFLKNNATTQFLITNPSSPVTSSMYNYGFNLAALAPTVLHPGCTNTPSYDNTGESTNNTVNCNDAIKFVGTGLQVPVYTPICFERGSSFSHFEDMYYPDCISPPPYGNDNYFSMSNAQLNTLSNNKRYLKPEERNALCDIGYSVKNTFGNTNTRLTINALGPYNYGGLASNGITVAGTNDGINPTNFVFTFTGGINTNIPISCSELLANDTSPTGITADIGIEYLQDLTTNTILLTTGTNTSIVNLNSSVAGIHLLRYIPTYGTQRGNITYVYVYVVDTTTNCATPNGCNLVLNGDFEQYSSLDLGYGDIIKSCGWKTASNGSPDYFNANDTGSSNMKVPCNGSGVQTSYSNVGNAYAGIGFSSPTFAPDSVFAEHVYTKLATPLVAGTKYQLSFDVSLAETYSSFAYQLHAYFSINPLPQVSGSGYLLTANGVVTTLIDPFMHTNYNGWERVTFNYTATGGEQYLYIGGLQNQQIVATAAAPLSTICNYTSYGNDVINLPWRWTYYYIDNVKLVAASFDLPTSLCRTSTIPNLASYLSTGTSSNSSFIGNGVTYNAITGFYSFQFPSGVSSATISYTYTNNLGCLITLQDTITAIEPITPTFAAIPVLCQGGTVPTLPTTLSGITGTWSPATISNTASGNYTFTPTAGQCANPINTAVQVLSSTAFVANADNFTVTLGNTVTTSVTTPSVLLNDTYNGNSISATIPGIPYTIVQVGTSPSIPAGGITFNVSTGIFTVLPNTTSGTYVYNYKITNNCFSTATKTVKIVVNRINGARSTQFGYCYNTNPAVTSTFTGNQTLYDGTTLVTGQTANATNSSITIINPTTLLTTTLPTGLSLNANGTVTVAAGTPPGVYTFYYKICSGGACTTTIYCNLTVLSTIATVSDIKTATAAPAGNVNCNVLSNDFYRGTCNSAGVVPITLGAGGNATMTSAPNQSLYYYINTSTGQVFAYPNSIIPAGFYVLNYTLCDNIYPSICATNNVTITVPNAARMSNPNKNSELDLEKTILAPNPTTGKISIMFNDLINSDYKLELYDVLGRLLIEHLMPKDTIQYELDLSSYSSGNYFIKIQDDLNTSLFHKTIVKQ